LLLERIDLFSLLDGPDHDTPVFCGASGLKGIPSAFQLVFIKPFLQPNNDTTFVDSYLLVKSLAFTIKENPQHVSPALETFLTNKKAVPAVFTDKLVTISEIVIRLTSFIISLLLKVDRQPKCLD
jgi:hypothetical protein